VDNVIEAALRDKPVQTQVQDRATQAGEQPEIQIVANDTDTDDGSL
jgi:hypothetical protein